MTDAPVLQQPPLEHYAPLTDEERDAFKGKLAVVTGASRGFGYAISTLLAECGAHVIAVARTVEGLEDLDDTIRAAGGEPPTLVPLNLTDGPGVDRLGASIQERWGKLDLFIGNAGVIGQVSPLTHVKAKAWAEAMEVNVSANWRLLRTLDPVLRAAGSARVVFITSGAAHQLRPYFGPYAVSKMALEGLAKIYAIETQSTGVGVCLFSPGPMRTALRAKARPGENPEDVPPPAEIAPGVLRLALAECPTS
ncbi:MAG: SDR family NAD(P)-dependent oxidoreductase [Pseudomonadota bacterium]